MIGKVKNFFEGARHEFRHVNWPTRKEALKLTLIVIGISVGIAIFLGLFDRFFAFILEIFVGA